MTAVVYQIRDYQSPKDLERMQRELEKEAAAPEAPKFLSGFEVLYGPKRETIPFGGQGIDGMTFTDKDSA